MNPFKKWSWKSKKTERYEAELARLREEQESYREAARHAYETLERTRRELQEERRRNNQPYHREYEAQALFEQSVSNRDLYYRIYYNGGAGGGIGGVANAANGSINDGSSQQMRAARNYFTDSLRYFNMSTGEWFTEPKKKKKNHLPDWL